MDVNPWLRIEASTNSERVEQLSFSFQLFNSFRVITAKRYNQENLVYIALEVKPSQSIIFCMVSKRKA